MNNSFAEIYASNDVATCIACGCDDCHACFDKNTGNPCHWLRVDRKLKLGVCSCCKHSVKKWDDDIQMASKPERP